MSQHPDVQKMACELVDRMVEKGTIDSSLRESAEFYMVRELERGIKDKVRQVGRNIELMMSLSEMFPTPNLNLVH